MKFEQYTFQMAKPSDLVEITELLHSSGLPSEDVGCHVADFLVLRDSGKLFGCIGLEMYGENGLLRSLVVERSKQKIGLGQQLVSALEKYAHKNNIQRLYLLTTTAAKFFEKCGYQLVERDVVPASIKQTLSFRALCPGSAAVLLKYLGSRFEA